MNQHRVNVFCGQIKFLHEFIDNFSDETVKVNVEQLNKIDMNVTVETELSGEETVKYLKDLLKNSPMGSALHFSVKLQ
ncbi:hypothetical protein [Robertmurraya kyonggiensis]|uniref:Uncharacterized protein n=1 Tax=Robertmurraya kyonggiensis TaxID=1037680 RepID=A0A4U1CXR3_9BACI|nr:hypothetical protein [Robertmurraya kyonggiensis]TKC14397.1 hypothetical protein FA727_21820 [Robertmurraya kyonggiensis]